MKKKRIIRDSIQIMKKNWKKIGLIMAFDVLFVLLLINLRFVSANVNGKLYVIFYQLNGIMYTTAIILLAVIESLLLIAIYAFFKYLILGQLQGIFKKPEVKFNRFFSFLKVNWILAMPIIIISMVFFMSTMTYLGDILSSGVNSPFSILLHFFVASVAALILLIYFYTALNIAQFIFLKETSLKKVIKQALIKSVTLSTYKIYWHDFKIVLISSLILLFFYSFMKLFVLTTMSAYLKYGGIYKTGLYLIMAAGIYFLLLFNRINFYQSITRN